MDDVIETVKNNKESTLIKSLKEYVQFIREDQEYKGNIELGKAILEYKNKLWFRDIFIIILVCVLCGLFFTLNFALFLL